MALQVETQNPEVEVTTQAMPSTIRSSTTAEPPDDYIESYRYWKTKYNIRYDDDREEQRHAENFKIYLEEMRTHNARPNITYKLGLTRFVDQNTTELARRLMTVKVPGEKLALIYAPRRPFRIPLQRPTTTTSRLRVQQAVAATTRRRRSSSTTTTTTTTTTTRVTTVARKRTTRSSTAASAKVVATTTTRSSATRTTSAVGSSLPPTFFAALATTTSQVASSSASQRTSSTFREVTSWSSSLHDQVSTSQVPTSSLSQVTSSTFNVGTTPSSSPSSQVTFSDFSQVTSSIPIQVATTLSSSSSQVSTTSSSQVPTTTTDVPTLSSSGNQVTTASSSQVTESSSSSQVTSSTKRPSPTATAPSSSSYPYGPYTILTLPTHTDFRRFSLTVWDQGYYCGSCWAMVAIELLESLMKIRNGAFDSPISPQYLIDCDTNNQGCYGGWPASALKFVQTTNNSMPSAATYPYTGVQGTCLDGLVRIPMGLLKVHDLFLGTAEEELKLLVATFGPIIVAVKFDPSLFGYTSGIVNDSAFACPESACYSVNHALVIYGYSADPVLGNYWLAKNSWGEEWGEQGFIRIARGKSNQMCIACWPAFAEIQDIIP